MSAEEQNAKKEEIKARMEANKNNPKPNLAGTGGPAAKIKPASGSPNNPVQQQSWISRMWTGIKNWWNNNFGGGNGNANTPTNQYAQAGAELANDQAQTWLNRGAAWLSNWLQSKGVDADQFINIGHQYAAAKAPELINKGANYLANKAGG
jgi:hypothetical protein